MMKFNLVTQSIAQRNLSKQGRIQDFRKGCVGISDGGKLGGSGGMLPWENFFEKQIAKVCFPGRYDHFQCFIW